MLALLSHRQPLFPMQFRPGVPEWMQRYYL